MDDSKETIDECLSCKKRECDNCVDRDSKREAKRAWYLGNKEKILAIRREKYRDEKARERHRRKNRGKEDET